MVLRSFKRALGVLLLSCPATGLMAIDQNYNNVQCAVPAYAPACTAPVPAPPTCAAGPTCAAVPYGAPITSDGGYGGYGGCGCDNGCDGGCGSGWTCYAGVEATFLSAKFNGDPNFITFVDNANGVLADIVNDNDGVDSLAAAPRLWVGVQNECGTGIVVRYWEMNQDDNRFDLYNPLLGDNIGAIASNDLEVYTLDAELTRSGMCGCWDVLGSFGVRHARLSHEDALAVFAYVPNVDDTLFAGAASGASFNGTGLTGALQGYRSLHEGCCGSFDLFGSGRVSFLWGNEDTYAAAAASVFGPGIDGGTVNAVFINGDQDLLIAEFQVGVQWSKYLKCCGSKAFARVAFEYQDWQAGQGDVVAASLATRPGVDSIGAFADTNDLDIKFYGVAIAAGLTW